jgi:phenylacetate-CoA ligase
VRPKLDRLNRVLAAAAAAPGWRRHWGQVLGQAPGPMSSVAELAALPVLRKSSLAELQRADPPFAGLTATPAGGFPRLFCSPGPILEPQVGEGDPGNAAPALRAAGFEAGDVAVNTFSYHLTPAGFTYDAGLRRIGCAVIPAGPSNTEQIVAAARAYRASGYVGTPDFLNILFEAADRFPGPPLAIRKTSLSGGALPASLRAAFTARGVAVHEAYGTAELGIIAYETAAHDGLAISDETIVEIVEPGSGRPVPDGETGEVVVTLLNDVYPLVRFATGDLSAIALETGRERRLKGWLGRADQSVKVKGMFVHPAQVGQIGARYAALGALRLVVTREHDVDVMTLHAETAVEEPGLAQAVRQTLREVTKLSGEVRLVPPGSLPRDGRTIADERRYR